ISYPAGSARMSPSRFGIYTLIGSIPFTLGFVYAGIALGDRWDTIAHYFTYLDYALVAIVALGVLYLIYLYVVRVRPEDRRAESAERAADASGSPPSPPTVRED
ncbi:SNARE associated domain protein, partial [mine drainage metagenome]